MEKVDEQFGRMVLGAWRGELDFPALIDFSSKLEEAGFGPLAAVLYQTFLHRNQSPYAHAVNFNLGVTLAGLNDDDGAISAYERAIALFPAFAQPRLNLGSLFERTGHIDLALEQWKWVAQNVVPGEPGNITLVLMALNHLGRVLDTKKEFAEALGFLTRSLTIEPNQPDVIHHWVHLRQKQCEWPVYAPLRGVSLESMKQSSSALAMMSTTDDPAAQLNAAQHYVRTKLNAGQPALASGSSYGHARLRIAYVSSDFCMHPVSLLTVQLFELHDRSNFEIYGFSWSPKDGSDLRKRVVLAMDHYIRIDLLSDEEAAKLIRSHEIDILVDLQGQTSGARANLLGYRPAPIQITYLGLPATTALPSIDYVIADRFLIPDSELPFYTEKPLYMPDVYQVSDRQRKVGIPPSRVSCGLPEVGFVFCSLNNNYKYTPEVFDIWMNILQCVPRSVLWLLSDNSWAQANLMREASSRGIDSSRLIFAPRVSPENYLARYALADLFLDTFPFNAGTTANDALWMGLPLLTCSGRAFASRMAGSLLTAAGLPELISFNLADYQQKAIDIALSPNECQRLKIRLSEVRTTGVLFDTPRFVQNLEEKFRQLIAELPEN